MTRVAVIPARGGSKRIPRKNIKPFCGKPMIAWSIEAAIASGVIDRIVVSTDDEEIAAVARAHGAEAPFVRPTDLADDHTGTTAVVAHAVHWLRAGDTGLAAVCCLYPTAPFVTPSDLQRGAALLAQGSADYVFSITSFAFPIQRALRLDAMDRVGMFMPEHMDTRSQDLEPAFHDAGQFYWGTPQAWEEERPIFSAASIGLRLPRHRVQDIDTPEDWARAELMFTALRHAGPALAGPA